MELLNQLEQASRGLSPKSKQYFVAFKESGFPTKKMEAWKYTSLTNTLKPNFTLNLPTASLTSEQVQAKSFTTDTHSRLVFINGVYNEALSVITEANLTVKPITEAFSHPAYATIMHPTDAFTQLNTAFASYGVYIGVAKNQTVATPVELLYFTVNDTDAFVQPRNFVEVAENAELRLVEAHYTLGAKATLTNVVTEVLVGKAARLDYYKIEHNTPASSLIDNTYISQEANSNASVHTFTLGGELNRNNLNFFHKGEHLESTLKGITILEDNQHTDHYTLVHHAQPNCESHQDYKSIVRDKATNVFNGKIMVDKIAQKTDAYQQNDNVLLGDKATVYTKPQLEIFADDVKCSHGCTVGEMDTSSLFYLQSRGIPKKEAQALLTYAFANSVISSVRIPQLKKYIENLDRKSVV